MWPFLCFQQPGLVCKIHVYKFYIACHILKHTSIAQFRYIKIQLKTTDITSLWGLGEYYKDLYGFIPLSLEMMPIVDDWILIHWNWAIMIHVIPLPKTLMVICIYFSDLIVTVMLVISTVLILLTCTWWLIPYLVYVCLKSLINYA